MITLGRKLSVTKHRVLSKSQRSIILDPPLNSSYFVPVSILSSIVLNDSIEIGLKPRKQEVKILPRLNLLSRSEKVKKSCCQPRSSFFSCNELSFI